VDDFASITLTGQLQAIDRIRNGAPVDLLIGSSMGGYLAALYAARHAAIRRVMCLAPAFDFAARWAARIGPDAMANWKNSGRLTVFHYGLGREAEIRYQLYEDALAYEPFPQVIQPVLIFHGRNDDVVPVELSREFSRRHRHVGVREVDSDHELINVLPEMWEAAWRFLSS
jgi:pimeloyl-ACP methyl ester carboxylesterase